MTTGQRRFFIGLGVLAVVSIASCALCFASGALSAEVVERSITPNVASDLNTREGVERFIMTSLPPNTQNFLVSDFSFTGNQIWVRFEAPPAEVESFVGELGIPLEEGQNPFAGSTDYVARWWDAADLTGDLRGGTHLTTGDPPRDYTLVINVSTPDLWRVYLEARQPDL